MANNFFNILKNITENKVPYNNLSQDEIKDINPFLLNRYLSLNENYIDLVNYCQNIPYEHKDKYYKIYLDLIPQKKIWLQYPKSKNKSYNKDLLEYLCKYFECSKREIKDYLTIIRQEDICNILYQLGVEDKDIKKMLK